MWVRTLTHSAMVNCSNKDTKTHRQRVNILAKISYFFRNYLFISSLFLVLNNRKLLFLPSPGGKGLYIDPYWFQQWLAFSAWAENHWLASSYTAGLLGSLMHILDSLKLWSFSTVYELWPLVWLLVWLLVWPLVWPLNGHLMTTWWPLVWPDARPFLYF